MPRKPPKLDPIDPTPAALTPEQTCAEGAKPVKAAAAFLGVGETTLKAMIRTRELPSCKVKGRRVVPTSALVLYLARRLDAA